jgi:hypothetical protein
MKAFSAIGLFVACLFLSTYAITITVSKDGPADQKSIQAALMVSQPGDVIMIMDSSTYNGQVTIDEFKSPLTIKSKNPTSLNKPKILWQDKANVGPRTYAESIIDSMITYDKNGALRLIKARNVIIDGIAIDGGGSYPFGYSNIWEARGGLQSGNVGIMLHMSQDIIIRNCDISNAYFGIYTVDRNTGGIFAQQNPADYDTTPVVPLSGFALSGNHLFEYNRIHNNSFGLFFESLWDLGSTVRYNLIFENHHASDSLAQKVHNLTSDEGANQPGGALFFKDVPLCPLAIYNNTFWHNFALLCGHWQAGYQHLVFNNIFGTPNKYWSTSTPSFNTTSMELTPALANRLYSSVFSAQAQAPQASYVLIMNNMAQIQGMGGNPPDPGTILAGGGSGTASFPGTADIRWLEMDTAMFISVNQASTSFLEPKWSDANVQKFIIKKGWQASGVKNTDGSWADLGAIEQAHGKPGFVGTIKPTMPIIQNGTSAVIQFTLDEREGTTLNDPLIKLFRLVNIKYKKDTFGSSGTSSIVVGSTDMADMEVPTTSPVKVGPNCYSTTANITGDYAFIEMSIEATGTDGKPFTTTGFLPYRKLDYKFAVEVWDTSMGQKLVEVRVGEPVVLRIIPQTTNNELFTQPINPLAVTLLSGFMLSSYGDQGGEVQYPNGIVGQNNKKVAFTKIPDGNIENISVSGSYRNPATKSALPFMGGTSIKVLSGPPEAVVFVVPPSNSRKIIPPTLPTGSTYACSLFIVDKFGNNCNTPGSVKIGNCCLSSSVKVIYTSPDSIFRSDSNGVVTFSIQTTDNARNDDIVSLVAQVPGSCKPDTAGMVVGPHVSVLFQNPGSKTPLKGILNQEVHISVFDMQGRRVFRRTFASGGAFSNPAVFLREFKTFLSSKPYIMEMTLKDMVTMKQTRSVQRILVR